MPRMKLCLVIPSLSPGGMERVMSQLLWEFSKDSSLDLHLILYGKTRHVFYEIPESVHIYRPVFSFRDHYRIWHTLKTFVFLRRCIKKINPDSILSFGEFWNSFALLAIRGLKFPIFISDRCRPDRRYNRFHAMLRRWLYPKASGIITQTRRARELYFEQFHHRNIAVIGNPIRAVHEGGEAKEREKVILSVGRLIKTKHYDQLIRIFSELDAPGWRLIIVGGNSSKQEGYGSLLKLIHDLGLKERVLLTGEISNVDAYYLRSRIFAFTSSSEGFPNAIGEAMAAGLPVVAYDCISGPSEMIEDGISGYLIPLFDTQAFRTRLQELVNNEELRNQMGQAGASHIAQYSPAFIAEKFKDFVFGLKDMKTG